MNFELNNLVAGFLFGVIGFGGWRYGRATGKPKKMVLGAALMAYPYLLENTYALWGTGIALTVALCFWKDE